MTLPPSHAHAPAMNARRAAVVWIVLALTALAVFVAALMLGSVTLSPARAVLALAHMPGQAAAGGQSSDMAGEIVRTLRLPRALAGFSCGALLALAGALLQVLLRNPLAEPYVLGVSGGACAFAVAALFAGWAWWLVDLASFGGAVLSIALVLGLARREFWRGEAQEASPRLLLTGIVVATGWGAIVTLLMALAPDERLRGIVFWLTGDLNGAGNPWPALVALAVALGLCVPVAPQLNALLRGEALAASLGVPTTRLRLRIYLVASLAACASVTTAGTIGFVGLVVP
ncbi:MAG: FecCD family ABC transporter permease, partial [Trinickia sp.]